MKDFNDFQEFIEKNGQTIDYRIEKSISSVVDDSQNMIVYVKSYTQATCIELLKLYHEWLNSEH